jgi:hypothetical protein
MSAYYQKIRADSLEELEVKIDKTIKELGTMRQPGVVQKASVDPRNESGEWFAVIKYWGLD